MTSSPRTSFTTTFSIITTPLARRLPMPNASRYPQGPGYPPNPNHTKTFFPSGVPQAKTAAHPSGGLSFTGLLGRTWNNVTGYARKEGGALVNDVEHLPQTTETFVKNRVWKPVVRETNAAVAAGRKKLSQVEDYANKHILQPGMKQYHT